MKKSILFLLAAATLSFAACSVSEPELAPEQSNNTQPQATIVPEGAIPGRIIVKMSEPIADTKSTNLFDFLGSHTIRRTFSYNERFDERHKAFGLDKWYTIHFDPSQPMTKAAGDIYAVEGVEHIDFDYRIEAKDLPFNDPYLADQWHYYNDGSKEGYVAGADINAFKAWEITKGSPNVIVAVCDSGVDYDHEDLAGNMWVNEAELNGTIGVDDDGNGYRDDIHGYNFDYNAANTITGIIQPENHGTHIAGTIAAVNNNGIGVSGIAGGNGSSSTGVRIMSVQLLGDYGSDMGDAIKYAADNGAVIMNCSWGLVDATSTPEFVKVAINYFNLAAGYDENGVQTGPMAGGVMFFAAGNDDVDYVYPGMEDNVFAVSAVGADMVKAYYANYGDWVDLCGPGGDAKKGPMILSTVIDNGYDTMQGTSMACPHVTGAAALIVSHLQGPGFSREQLIHIIKQTSHKEFYDYNLPAFKGKLGVGLVDAYAAMNYVDPELMKVENIKTEVNSNTISLTWTIPGAEGAFAPYRFVIYKSNSSLANLDPKNPGSEIKKYNVEPSANTAGDDLSISFPELEFEKEYHFRIAELDIHGNYSELSEEIILTTPANNAPVIEAMTETSVRIGGAEKFTFKFKISDPDAHPITYKVKGFPITAVKHSIEDSVVSISFDAGNSSEVEPGKKYEGTLTVSDPYNSTTQVMTVDVFENTNPYVTNNVSDIVLNGLGEKISLNLLEYFGDDDESDVLKFNISISPSTQIIKTNSIGADGVLEIEAYSYGQAKLTITASDGVSGSESVSQTVNLLIRDGSQPIDLYPNPVVKDLNIRSGESMTANIVVSSKSGAVVANITGAEIGPFSPQIIDFSGLSAGAYYVQVTGGGVNETYSIFKK